jgi:hypothetical protein
VSLIGELTVVRSFRYSIVTWPKRELEFVIDKAKDLSKRLEAANAAKANLDREKQQTAMEADSLRAELQQQQQRFEERLRAEEVRRREEEERLLTRLPTRLPRRCAIGCCQKRNAFKRSWIATASCSRICVMNNSGQCLPR